MHLYSLRTRYALISLALGLLVLIAAISGHYLLTHTRQQSAQQIDTRQRLLSQSRVIRNRIWQVRAAIGQFLIDPDRQDYQTQINSTVVDAMNESRRLLNTQPRLKPKQYAQILRLTESIRQLKRAADDLIRIRLDSNLQFPGLVLARDDMLPRQQLVFDAFDNALAETAELQADNPKEFRIYQLLIKARHRWSTIISDVRMLIASRLGSYGLDSVKTQISDIELYIADFKSIMQQLKSIQNSPLVGLQTSYAIDQIDKQYADWYGTYQQIISIHNSNKWRSDAVQLHQRINPILEDIWSTLKAFDGDMDREAELDINNLGSLAQQQGQVIWILGAIALFFVIVGYISFDRAVLKPMLMLAKAFLQEARNASGDVILPRASSTEIHNLIRAFSEMRNQIHDRQFALEHQAEHDSLTGLANRNLFIKKLQQKLKRQKRNNDNICLIMLDLDRFKEANDALGHHIGDLLLIEVGRRLRKGLRNQDVVARLGGDEFAILLNGADELQARDVCKKILKSFEEAFQVQEYQLFVGASMGIAVYPKHGQDAATMMKRADIAMYVAKRNHLGFAFYEATNDNNNDQYLSLAHDLQQALIDESMSVVYQLKYDVKDNLPVGVEVLLRWQHPQLGGISPVNIVPLAEQLGVINRLTFWVMEKAMAQCALWRQQGIYISMAINLSVYDLLTSELVDQINRLLDHYQVPASYVIFEITENAMLIDPDNAISILKRLDQMGLRIAIDDFGAGFSSLGYLKKLPVDELKIDKSFVMDMITNDNDAVIVRSTIDLAHNLGLKVVAEGVESEEIFDLLRILRCDTAQGFYLAKPMDAETVTDLLSAASDTVCSSKTG